MRSDPMPPTPETPCASGRSPGGSGLPRLLVLIHGRGRARTLRNLAERIARGELRAEIALVLATHDAEAAAIARDELGLRVLHRPGNLDAHTLDHLAREERIDLVVLAGYLRLLEIPPGLEGRVVNIHPALLPDFGGPGMYGDRVHAAVLAAASAPGGPAESGCTVHLCDNTYDTGPVLAQARVPILPGDTPQTLAARVFEAECGLYPRVIADLLQRRG